MLGPLPLSLGLFVSAALGRLAVAKDVQGGLWCGTLMCVTGFVNDSVITYEMTALNQMGWMAIGFGTQMADATMVIMWPNADGGITLSQRTATGLVEPTPDPSPPRIAQTYQPLSSISAIKPTLSFTIAKDGNMDVNLIWAFGNVNPESPDSAAILQQHVDSGNFTLDISKELDDDDIPSAGQSQTLFNPSATSTPPDPSESAIDDDDSGGDPLRTFEKLIVGHAVMTVMGFLIVLPLGAIIARWGRTFTERWFKYHWVIQVAISIPIVMIGWTLGMLSVADQGKSHADDVHKIVGVLLLPLYLTQLFLGSYIHFRKPPYPTRHPPQNFVHAGLGILVIGLAFYEARTGITVEWTIATGRSINLIVFSNLWTAWTVFMPAIYFAGMVLIPRQLQKERESPPPYTPPEDGSSIGVTALLELGPTDDGTHAMFSENASRSRSRSPRSQSESSTDIEMREVVPIDRWSPISLATSASR